MRLRTSLFDNRLNVTVDARPLGDITGPQRGEAGAEAERWYTDLAGGGPDINPELTGSAKFHVYDEMAKTDASVKSLLLMPSLAVRSASWGLNPKDHRDPLDVLIRDLVAWNLGLEGWLGELDLSWDKQLQQALLMLRWGCIFEELVWADVRTFRDADGDEHLVRPLARLAPRPPATVSQLNRVPSGAISTIEQSIPDTRPIPGEKLSYMVFEPEPGQWDGVSMLRPAWFPWQLKKGLAITAGIGWDRFMMGLPVVYHPDNPAAELEAKNIGRNVRGHERSYVNFPLPPGGSKEDAEWALEILNAASTLADPTPLLKWCCEQIAEAGVQQFSKLGMTDTGSRAVGDVQIEPFYMAVETLADDIRRERMRQVIRRLVEVNFGLDAAEHHCPVLTVTKIQSKNVETIARAVALLAPLGFTLTDDEAQDDVRELLGFSKLNRADLADRGVDTERLEELMREQGVDEITLAAVLDELPEGVGVARNTVEGEGLAVVERPSRGRAARLQETREADAEQARALEAALTGRIDALAVEVRALAARPADAPAAQPITVNVPANTPDARLLELLTQLVERELPAPSVTYQAAPMTFEITVPGDPRRRRAVVRRVGDETIVEYENEEAPGG